MKYSWIYILLVIGFLIKTGEALGQGPPRNLPRPGGSGGFPGSSGGGSGSNSPVVLDTSDIFYFYADNPNIVYPFSDSLLETFQQYDPIRLPGLDFAHLGNLGSAHRPLFYQPAWRRGFDVGLHQYDLYQMKTSDIRYYKITQAYTQAIYTQGPTQTDAQFLIRFSRNFADGINLSIEHRRINNAGAYDFQKATDSDVAVGLRYHNKGGRYDGYFSFVTNSVQQQNNGGTAESLTDTIIPPFQVTIHTQTSQTRHANKEYAYTQYFYLNKIIAARKENKKTKKEAVPVSPGADSLKIQPPPAYIPSGPPVRSPQFTPSGSSVYPFGVRSPQSPPKGQAIPYKRAYTLYHQFAWRTDSYKFFDTDPDSAFYGNFLVDTRGLRQYLETRKLENTFKLQTFKLREKDGKPTESDLLEVGLVHSLHLIDQEPLGRQTQNNLFLTGRLHFSPGERMRLESYAHLGVGANAGDFRMNGVLFLDFKKVGNLRLDAVNQLYSPSLLQERLFVSQQEFWNKDNDFKKTLETSLSGTYSLPDFHFSITGQYHLVSNMVYFDMAAMPRQSGAFSVVQLMARKDFHLGSWHLENWVGLQQSTSDMLRVPQFYSKHSLYLQKKIFKKVMLAKIGMDARITAGYDAPGYHPLTGQFYLQDERTLPLTPLLDGFLCFQVKTFRFFIKIENMLTFPLKEYYYQTAGYPLPFGFNNGGMRFGISWRLVD